MQNQRFDTLVLSGGGIKGIVYIGAFKRLHQLVSQCKITLDIKKIYAVSVGVIFALLYSVGWTPEEMEKELLELNLEKLKSSNIALALTNYGVDSGKKLIKWIAKLMNSKGYNQKITLSQLYTCTGIDLHFMVTNLDKYAYQSLNHLTDPDLNVLEAVRMSISFPFAFSAQKYKGDYCVDGCIINNYPFDVSEGNAEGNAEGVLGLRIMNYEQQRSEKEIDDIQSYITSIFHCYFFSKEKSERISKEVNKCTVYITCNRNALDFNLTKEEKLNLINLGYESVNNFFK